MGGLMATYYAHQQPERVKRLILLAPAFSWPVFADNPLGPIDVPTTIYHGQRDTIIPFEIAQKLARQTFHHLAFHAVDDDHRLHKTVSNIDWPRQVG